MSERLRNTGVKGKPARSQVSSLAADAAMRHPARMHLRRSFLGILLLAMLPAHAMAQGQEPPFPMKDSWRRNRAPLARFDQLDRGGRGVEAWRYLDSLISDAVARGDRSTHMQLLIKRGGTRSYRGEFDRGEADLVAAERLALGLRDTLGMLEATRWRALARSERDRDVEAARLWTRMRDWARAWGSPSHEGWARCGLALADLDRGRLAEATTGYRIARERFAAAPDPAGLRQAGVGLLRVLTRQERYDEMRELTLQQVREARAADDKITEAQLLNNLGSLEWWLGDPRRSLDLMRQSLAAFREGERRTGRPVRPVTYVNLARALARLGQADEAATLLERASESWRPRDANSWAEIETALASVRLGQNRAGEAERRIRAVLSKRDSLTVETRNDATALLMLAVSGQGRNEESLALALRHRADIADAPRGAGGSLRTEIARAFLRGGRADDAMTLISEAAPVDTWVRPARWDHAASFMRTWAMAEQGRLAEAAARLPLLTQQLLALRRVSRDYTARESFSHEAGDLATLTARVLTDPDLEMSPALRAVRVFDALQPLKAITLDERMRAPGAPDSTDTARPVLLSRLRTRVLQPGELLLDLHACGPHLLLLAVSRRDVRLVDLGSSFTLGPRIERMHEVLTGVDRVAADEAATALGRTLLAEVADLVQSHPVLLLSPSAHPIALAALRLPGAREPLGASHSVAMVPSATVLARLRARSGHANAPLVALAGGEDARGRRLSGARAEVRWLGLQFAGVRLPDAVDAESAMRALRGAGIAHLAGHSEVDEDNPWGSRLLLGDASRAESWLRASRVARTRLSARLAVLSGCSSIGSSRRGEGVLGLSSAFLSAGVPSTLASLWEIEDAQTAETMKVFYRALAEGVTASEALQRAQAELRGRAATSAPRDWAAFTLVGLPETRVTLRRTLASRVLP